MAKIFTNRAKEFTYRASFGSTSGKVLYLDFYAENLEFARLHARQMASHAPYGPAKNVGALHVVTVRRARTEFDATNAGSWLVKCPRCGSFTRADQSCGCFDNASQ